MIWRLYYDNWTTFSSEEGETYESPVWGAVGAIQPPQRGRTATAIVGKNGDYLLFRTDLGVWHLVGASGLDDHLCHFGHLIECVRKTRWMPIDSEFSRIWEKMRADALEAGYAII